MRNIGISLFMICLGAAGCTKDQGGDGLAQDQQQLETCGGIAGTACAAGFICVDNSSDGCDPASGADCSGFCVEEATNPPQQCGGFANLQCPKDLTCVDDPGDNCDPTNGGADCIGICV
ncbi:MAG: hypothetical protein ABI134_33330, partial [Byssovorax sp.]